MNRGPSDPLESPTTTLRVELAIGGARVSESFAVPRAPTRPARMLPVFRGIAERVIGAGIRALPRRGAEIPCEAGCAACCRQLAPVSEAEARRLLELVEAMPEPRRSDVIARFDGVRRRLADAGLLERLEGFRAFGDDDVEEVSLAYQRLWIDCPFLEGELCSIHAERPIACREFLVTSAPEHCKTPTAETVRAVDLASRASDALARLDGGDVPRDVWWLPLPFAIDWAREHPDERPPRPATELLNEFLSLLAAVSEPEEEGVARGKGPAKKGKGKRRKKRR